VLGPLLTYDWPENSEIGIKVNVHYFIAVVYLSTSLFCPCAGISALGIPKNESCHINDEFDFVPSSQVLGVQNAHA
jgi:hypothetical protein